MTPLVTVESRQSFDSGCAERCVDVTGFAPEQDYWMRHTKLTHSHLINP